MKMELLAPAGNRERLLYALAYGADAVYGAYRAFGLRAGSDNFDEEGLAEAIRLAHGQGKKIYVTVNIYANEADLAALPAFLERLAAWNADGVIVSDPGVLALVKRYAPGVAIHISTQANVTNSEAAKVYAGLGASRIVLAREMPLAEIAALHEKVPALELECFVHGAMCISYSGRCLLSAVMTGRSANRGACAHPCRWRYTLTEATRPGAQFPAEEDERGTYVMNSRDLCLMPYLKELRDAGVSSFKIEGRMKSFYYTACITRAYRRALDDLAAGKPFDPGLLAEAEAVSNRGYTTGFLFGRPGAEAQNTVSGGYRRESDVVAVAAPEPGWLIQKNKFSVGETLWVIAPQGEPVPVTVTEIRGEDGTPQESAPHPEQRIQCNFSLPSFGMLRRMRKTGEGKKDE